MIKAAECRWGNLYFVISDCMLDKGLWLYRSVFCMLTTYSVQCIIVNMLRRCLCCLPQCDVILTSQYSTSQNEMIEIGGLFPNIFEREKKIEFFNF